MRNFDGINLDEWLVRAEQYFAENPLTEEEKVEEAMAYFDGEAWAWYERVDRLQSVGNWSELKLLMIVQFQPPRDANSDISSANELHGRIGDIASDLWKEILEGKQIVGLSGIEINLGKQVALHGFLEMAQQLPNHNLLFEQAYEELGPCQLKGLQKERIEFQRSKISDQKFASLALEVPDLLRAAFTLSKMVPKHLNMQNSALQFTQVVPKVTIMQNQHTFNKLRDFEVQLKTEIGTCNVKQCWVGELAINFVIGDNEMGLNGGPNIGELYEMLFGAAHFGILNCWRFALMVMGFLRIIY